jgi:hypothetical protein
MMWPTAGLSRRLLIAAVLSFLILQKKDQTLRVIVRFTK